MTRSALIPVFGCLVAAWPALADPPRVVAANATSDGGGRWTISVTLEHPDTGWDHYASGWKVLAPDGTLLGLRNLTHPHVDEQPFERARKGVEIPPDLTEVLIVPRCTLDGWVAMPVILTLPAP
ncbi:MAG TPA: hypothetical protein PLI43_07280 [Albidovulum sp.]|uniref:hypothetical protein n=1 Tax=Albidovulum sp. TaxID=1872424 RepID=UPI002BEC1B0C|nr:hypothetical protein [Albidovulum sp.]